MPRYDSTLVCVVFSLLAGCAKKPTGPMPVCLAEVVGSEAAEAKSQTLPPDVWFSILLKRFDRKSMQPAPDDRDCSGRPLAPVSAGASACLQQQPAVALQPVRPLVADDLVQAPAGERQELVWVKARMLDNGEAIGPVALVEWIDQGVAVRAIGTLRAQATKPRLRLETVDDTQVLVVESDACPEDPTKCVRVVQLVPLTGTRFDERAMLRQDGACLGRAQFDLFRQVDIELGPTKLRTFEVNRTLKFAEGRLSISETISVKDRDPTQPDVPSQTYRQATAEHPVQLGAEGFVTADSLWAKMLEEHGSVRADPTPAPSPAP